jgi:HEPN domain-containing protein
MELLPNHGVASTADIYQEAANVLYQEALKSGNANLSWAACINAALASEIYLKSFLAKTVLTPTGFGPSMKTQTTKRGHDLLVLYKKIAPTMQSEMLIASKSLDSRFNLVNAIEHCKSYFFNARYNYECEALIGTSSVVIDLADHLRLLVREVAKVTHPKIG